MTGDQNAYTGKTPAIGNVGFVNLRNERDGVVFTVRSEGENPPLASYEIPNEAAAGIMEAALKNMREQERVRHMVNRFLGWRLPENFNPDGGVSFKPTFNDHMPTPSKHEPSGTNLFDYMQAEAMVRYMLEGLGE